MYALIIILLATNIHAQYQCSCSCCLGQFCQPTLVGTVSLQNCSTDLCLTRCRCTYPQCLTTYPYGQIDAQCTPPVPPLSICQCLCCNTGSATCTPTLVGQTTAYSCHPSACGIACNNQYPFQCVSSQYGQTQGVCIGSITTTTTTTPITPWLGFSCSCSYHSSATACSSNTLVGMASSSQCTISSCTQACQSRFAYGCSSTYFNQISGVCSSQPIGRTKCKCNCSGQNFCMDYEVSTNGTCADCYSSCQQASPCLNPISIIPTCISNSIVIAVDYILCITLFILITNYMFCF